MRPSPEITVPVLEGKTDAKTEAVIDRTACKKGRRKFDSGIRKKTEDRNLLRKRDRLDPSIDHRRPKGRKEA
ncbi:hypothetical protein E3N88_23800 [Mikania micrantha]|uniref:Uncharacterized protein n=1 Tax=Mikania micrantha TaxID=192012 RepID=A0A5N6NFC7_9ASTR|nr:hypothetical protein E3N88_23800 [Mikania micrantha]